MCIRDRLVMMPSSVLPTMASSEYSTIAAMRWAASNASLLFGDLAGGGENAEDVSACVAVDRGVVQNVGQGAVPVAQGERVVGDRPLRENLLVALVSLVGVGEVTGEVGPEELVAGDAGDLDRGLVDVGDPAFGADRHQRVQGCLDQAPGIQRCMLQLGHVAADHGGADD